MTDVFVETWEGGTDGAACTLTNTSFDAFFGSDTLTFSNAHVVAGQGSLGGHVTTVTNNRYAEGTFSAPIATAFVNFPFRSVAAPSSSTVIGTLRSGSTILGYLRVTTDRRLRIQNASGISVADSPAGTVADGQDGRIEWLIDCGAGRIQARYFAGVSDASPAWDSTALAATIPAGTIDNLHIGGVSAGTWEFFIGDIYVNDTAWHSYAAGLPVSGTIAYPVTAVHSQVTGTGTTISVTVPAGVQGQDQMTLKFIGGSASGWTDTAPAGWTAIGIPQTGGVPTFRAWKRLAAGTVGSASSDVGSTVTVTSNNTTGAYFRNLHLEVYRAAVVGDAASHMETANVAAHHTPSVTTVDSHAWIEAGCADRDNPGSTGFTLSSGLTARSTEIIASGGSAVSSVVASDDLVGAGTPPTYTITGSSANASALTWAIVLEPSGGTVNAVVTLPSDFSSEPWIDTTVTPTITGGTAASWAWAQIAPTTPDIVTGATIDANGTIHLHLPGDLAEQVYTLRVTAHVTGQTPDPGDTMVITVYPATRRWVAPDGTVMPLRIEQVL